jgi:hypothetical protein
METVKALTAFASARPAAAAVIATAVLTAAFMAWFAVRRLTAGIRGALRGRQAEDLLTVVAAGLAQAVVMTGMWRFAGNVLHFSGAERGSLFAFLEVAVVTCAFRARRNMRQFSAASAEGIAVWVLSGLSAMFSAMDARSAAEAVFRLAAPLVAAWLWHRAMSLEHRRSFGRVLHWRLTAERVLVWVGLAEPSARAVGEVDAHRRIARLARAARRLRELRASGARSWRQERARRRLDRMLEGAVEHADLASDPARQDQMRDQIGTLNAAGTLADLDVPAPWERRQAEAAEAATIRAEAAAMADDAARTAEAAIRAAAGEAALARDLAAKATGEARARVHALEESVAAERARAETAERNLAAARAGDGRTGPVDRDAVVAELAGQIRDAIEAGERWKPDYPGLKRRSGYGQSWAEKVVREARTAATFPDARTDGTRTHTGNPYARTDECPVGLALANGHAPPAGALQN